MSKMIAIIVALLYWIYVHSLAMSATIYKLSMPNVDIDGGF